MRWKHKALLQQVLSYAPGGRSLNALLQRLAARSSAFADSAFQFRVEVALSQLDAALPILRLPEGVVDVYEFGTGSDLIGPLTFWARGVRKQVLVDRSPLVSPRLVARTAERLARAGMATPPLEGGDRRRLLRSLRAAGIDYRAPVDARATGLPSESMDLIVSNSTLEHIPREDLAPLLTECRRLLKPKGVLSFRIDYEDHYAIHDRSLSSYNFLRYSDREWRRYNSPLHFQNRLRHGDYVALFERLDLVTLAVETLAPSPRHLAELAAMPVHESFRASPLPELGIRKGVFLLGKAAA